jgi:hypothetical protein
MNRWGSGWFPCAATALLIAGLAGCGSVDGPDPFRSIDPDPIAASTLAALAPVAARGAEVAEADVTGVSCWRPGEHLVEAAGGQPTYRVICRVDFDAAGQNRYRDVICIGVLGGPAPEYCVRWAKYTDEPGFADFDAVRAS